jgi:hypothetical protein
MLRERHISRRDCINNPYESRRDIHLTTRRDHSIIITVHQSRREPCTTITISTIH